MPPPTTSPVAFSLSAPLARVVKETRRRPLSTLGPVAALLLPLLPLAAGAQFVLANGGSGALQGFLAGAPAGKPGALILRPGLQGWLLLAALFALLTATIAVVVAAGLATGASSASRARRGERPAGLRVALPETLAVWPAMFIAIATQLLLTALGGAAIIVAGSYAGHLRFQLTSVVIVFGLGTLVVWLVRGSLWPATALAEDLPPASALRRSWEISEGSVLRLLGAAITTIVAVLVPALVLRFALKLLLTALANHGIIGLSPIAIDLLALVPVPVAIFLLSALWGREAPLLHDALVADQHRVLAETSLDTA